MADTAPSDQLSYDPLALAFDELGWCSKCGVTPLRWSLGVEASALLVIKGFAGNRMALESMGLQLITLCGLPVCVDPGLDPKTVKLIHELTT
jgi:hypothetical protein